MRPAIETELAPFWKAICLSAAAMLVGGALAAVICWVQPIADPVEVVGVPLLEGYSERSEQATCFAFLLGSFLTAVALRRPILQSQTVAVQVAGALGLLFLTGVCFWTTAPASLPLASLGAAAAYLAGTALSRERLERQDGLDRRLREILGAAGFGCR